MTKKRLYKALAYTFMILFSIVQLGPLVWLFLSSFKTNNEIITQAAFALPHDWIWQNYVLAWVTGKVGAYFVNSILISLFCLVATLLLSTMTAYAIARMRWKASSLVLFVFLAGLMVPIHVTLIPLFIILKGIGLLGSPLGILLPYVSMGLPLGVFVMVNFLRSMPMELEYAAAIDGCGLTKTFFVVILPVTVPGLSAVGIFTFLNVWNEFIMASTLISSGGGQTLPLGLMAFQGAYSTQWAPLSAAIMLASIPVIIFYMIFSEQVERSFSAGALLK